MSFTIIKSQVFFCTFSLWNMTMISLSRQGGLNKSLLKTKVKMKLSLFIISVHLICNVFHFCAYWWMVQEQWWIAFFDFFLFWQGKGKKDRVVRNSRKQLPWSDPFWFPGLFSFQWNPQRVKIHGRIFKEFSEMNTHGKFTTILRAIVQQQPCSGRYPCLNVCVLWLSHHINRLIRDGWWEIITQNTFFCDKSRTILVRTFVSMGS